MNNVATDTPMNCINCNTLVTSKFCCDCGRPAKVDRVNWHYIVHEIRHVLHFEKGILRTVKDLLLKPGTSIHTFIKLDRSRLVKPVIFIIVTSLIYSAIEHLFHIKQGYMVSDLSKDSAVSVIFTWIQNHYGYGNIIMSVFIAFWLRIMFKKSDYNFFEILILLCFVMGMGMLIFSVFAVFEGVTGISTMKIAGPLGLVYCFWAIGYFFNRTRLTSYLKAIASYLLGVLTFSMVMIIFGLLIDFIKH